MVCEVDTSKLLVIFAGEGIGAIVITRMLINSGEITFADKQTPHRFTPCERRRGHLFFEAHQGYDPIPLFSSTLPLLFSFFLDSYSLPLKTRGEMKGKIQAER